MAAEILTMRSKGERSLVEFALGLMKNPPPELLPKGDDAAALLMKDGRALVLKTDFLAGLTDVPAGMTARQVGWKAVTMNVSDLVAKGATPVAMLFSLGFPGDYDYAGAEELVSALSEACSFYGAEYIGGDVGESEGLIVAGMAAGLADKGGLMRRDGARPGDILAVTGRFGYTSLGLKLILGQHRARGATENRAVESVYNPRARLKEGIALSSSRSVTASIDSSDGLAWSLHELSKASDVGFRVTSLPTDAEFDKYARSKKLDVFPLVFYGGEEYEIVCTVSKKAWAKAERSVGQAGGRLIKIGEASREKKVVWAPPRGREMRIERRGYEHFRED